MSANNDQNFVKTVLGVIGALVALTFVILIIAALLTGKTPTDAAALQKLQTRVEPIGHEITDPEEFKKLTAVAPHTPLAGDQVVAQVCSACHGAGVLGAPKIGDKAAWSARKSAAGGVDGLATSAEKGKNSMPARGGRADLSNDEIKAAVQEMLKQTGV
ncbi:MAG: cytochrome c5 family protein [Nevskia sp.]|nr:cytochrome c5 family protein [Nevskia sp.]